MAVSKFDPVSFWLLVGGFGWFALSYALALGGRRRPLSALVWTLFYSLITYDCLYIPGEIFIPVLRRVGIGWRFIAFFDVLPYLLFAARVRWLCVRRRLILK